MVWIEASRGGRIRGVVFDVNAEQQQILRLTNPELKKTFGAPFAQDDSQSFWVVAAFELLSSTEGVP
jgi:hypothetical protein